MKVHLISDLHLEFGPFSPPRPSADVVVLAGDIDLGTRGIEWAQKHFPDVSVVMVAGNHEYYRNHLEKNLAAMKAAAQATNVSFLENDAVRIGDTVFAGCTLWTDFGLLGDPVKARRLSREVMNDYRVIRTEGYRLLRPDDTERMHAESVAWLQREIERHRGEKLVIVTHHTPSARSVPERFASDPVSASFSSRLDWLVEASGAAAWVHGHTHDSFDYCIGKTRVMCNPRGYLGVEPNPTFDPGLVVEV